MNISNLGSYKIVSQPNTEPQAPTNINQLSPGIFHPATTTQTNTNEQQPGLFNRFTSAGAFSAAPVGQETMGSAALKTAGNVIPSAIGFVKGLAGMGGEALKTVTELPKNLAKLPGQLSTLPQQIQQAKQQGLGFPKGESLGSEAIKGLYQTLVPKFFQQLFAGDTEGAQQTIINDPSGTLIPVLLTAKGLAEAGGVGPQFDKVIENTSKLVTKPAEVVGKGVGKIAGEGAAQTLGVTTGAGSEAIKSAVKGSPEFQSAMRGETSPESIVKMSQDAFQKVVDQRRQEYLKSFQGLSEYTKSADITSLKPELKTQLDNFGVKVNSDGKLDFSRSSIANNTSARGDIQGVYDTLKTWGTKAGDRTVQGLDTLKKQLTDFYSPSGEARAFVQAIKSNVRDILNRNYPKYEEMTSAYSKASDLLAEIKSATSLGGKAGADTVFTKITRAMKMDTGLRKEMLNLLEEKSGQKLKDYIAGTQLSGFTPKGAGGLVDAGAAYMFMRGIFNPTEIPVLLSTSPRIVGEFLNALGIAKNGIAKVTAALQAINKSPEVMTKIIRSNKQK